MRFRKLDDLLLELIGESIALMGLEEFVSRVKIEGSTRKSRRRS